MSVPDVELSVGLGSSTCEQICCNEPRVQSFDSIALRIIVLMAHIGTYCKRQSL